MPAYKSNLSKLHFLIPLFTVLLLWELSSCLNLINSALFSCPSEIALILYQLTITKSPFGYSVLLTHIFTSLYRLALALLIATGVGISLGILMGTSRYSYRCLNPLITVLMPIPGIAWAPIFMLYLGFGDPTLITVGALAAFFPVVYNTTAGVKSVDKRLIWSAKSMGAAKAAIFTKVLIPSSLKHITTGIKLGLARGWRTIIATEMIAASLWGLGFMIFDAREYLQPSIIYGGIIVLAVIFLLIEKGVDKVERRTVGRWFA